MPSGLRTLYRSEITFVRTKAFYIFHLLSPPKMSSGVEDRYLYITNNFPLQIKNNYNNNFLLKRQK